MGSPWENGYVVSFNARLRDKLPDGEIFHSLREAQIIIEGWRRHYTAFDRTSHSDTPTGAGSVFAPAFAAWPSTPPRSAPPATLPLALKSTTKPKLHPDHWAGADQIGPPN
jgi:hypothetical protein